MESGADTGGIHCIVLAVTWKLLRCRNYFLLPFSVGGVIPYLSMFLGKPVGQGRTVYFLGSAAAHFWRSRNYLHVRQSDKYGFFLSQNYIVSWVGRDLRDLVPTPLLWARMPSIRPGCSEPCPAFPGVCQLLNSAAYLCFFSFGCCLEAGIGVLGTEDFWSPFLDLPFPCLPPYHKSVVGRGEATGVSKKDGNYR